MIVNTGSRGLFQLTNNAQGIPVVSMLPRVWCKKLEGKGARASGV